jgi:hypothetical protein
MFARTLSLLAVAWLIAGCFGGEEQPPSRGRNSPPEASLRAPVIAPLGVPVALDASSSTDRDADPLTYVFDFGDGSAPVRSNEPVVQHVFSSEGLFSVRVQVLDPSGGGSVAVQDIAVRAGFPDSPHLCDKASDCVVGDDCEAGVCFSTGGTLE